jgi:23S rRNA (cytosine1962-C5)-methyltransferase
VRGGYELIDAGNGRRLERFGDLVVDRPAPSAHTPRRAPDAWASADLAFIRERGWTARDGAVPDAWQITLDKLTFELRPTESGQVGLFPEQIPNWGWLADAVSLVSGGAEESALNLFAYTGGATLALAAAGAAATHVDASRPAVAWARRNAALCGLDSRPIRWLVDDADAFVAREARRGRRYGGIVLDPPSYGHGPGGRSWHLEQDLPSLLERAFALAGDQPNFALVTAHTPGFGADRLADTLSAALVVARGSVEFGRLDIAATSGALLSLGAFARWPAARARHAG